MIRRHVHALRLSVALLAASVFLLTFSFPVKAQTTSGFISGTIENLNTELLNAYDLLTIHTIADARLRLLRCLHRLGMKAGLTKGDDNELDINSGELAEMLSITPSYLSRLQKTVYHRGPLGAK